MNTGKLGKHAYQLSHSVDGGELAAQRIEETEDLPACLASASPRQMSWNFILAHDAGVDVFESVC